MKKAQQFKNTHSEILAAYSTPNADSKRIYFEYSSTYRRIVVLGTCLDLKLEPHIKAYQKTIIQHGLPFGA